MGWRLSSWYGSMNNLCVHTHVPVCMHKPCSSQRSIESTFFCQAPVFVLLIQGFSTQPWLSGNCDCIKQVGLALLESRAFTITPDYTLFFLKRQNFSLNLELTASARLESQRVLGIISTFPDTGMHHHSWLFCGGKNLSWGPHTLSTELSPAPDFQTCELPVLFLNITCLKSHPRSKLYYSLPSGRLHFLSPTIAGRY